MLIRLSVDERWPSLVEETNIAPEYEVDDALVAEWRAAKQAYDTVEGKMFKAIGLDRYVD